MTFVYLICFLLIAVGAILLLKLTPETITNDLMKFVSPKQTLRDKVLTAKGKKKSRKLTVELNRIRDALEQTGKGGQFTIACAASVLLMIIGSVVAILIDNPFLVPVFAFAFALIPFVYAKRTVNYYDNHIKEELETALSIITTSYVRTDDIVTAVKENVQYLKPPVKDIFAGFVAENMMISSDIKQSIRHLKEKVSNTIFDEWCDTLIACQDDRTLKDTLMPIVAKLTDVRIVNNEIKGMLSAARTEYWMMAAMVVGNIPLLYFLNKDWYAAYNSELGDKPFAEKKEKLADVHTKVVTLYADVKDCEVWNADAIENRADKLVAEVQKLFAIEQPTSVVKFTDPRYSEYTCDIPENATYKTPNYYILQGERVNVSNFSEMLRSLVDRLYAKDKSIVERMAKNNDRILEWSQSVMFSYDSEKVYGENKIKGTDIYVNVGYSAAHIICVVKELLTIFDIDTSEFVYSARSYKNDSKQEEDNG